MLDLASVESSLDERATPVSVFFRDDDAGWDSTALESLVEELIPFDVELDLALIPSAINEKNRVQIATLVDHAAGRIHLHQHGYSHLNHEPVGRKCEFGAARPLEVQKVDIERGRRLLLQFFADRIEPIFTPPWNRCNQDTAEALVQAGINVLSRDAGAAALSQNFIAECPIHLDWQKKRNAVRLSGAEFTSYVIGILTANDVVGIMLHHAEMSSEDRGQLCEFVSLLRNSGRVTFSSISKLAFPRHPNEITLNEPQ